MRKSAVENTQSIVPFSYESKDVRTIQDEHGNPWFIAKDVCSVLEIANPTQAVQQLDDDERAMKNIGRQGEANIINESGLYTLIIRSNKPEAKKFRKWVTSEVLPAIRKTGTYTMPTAGMKICSRCSQTKPFSAFDKNHAKHDGYNYSCKECVKEMARIRYNSRKVNAGIAAETPAKALPMEPVGEHAVVFNRILGDLDDAAMARKLWKIFHDMSLVFIGKVADIEQAQNITDVTGVSYDEIFARIERLEILKFGEAQRKQTLQ